MAELTWITSFGGPLMLIPKELSPDWEGTTVPEDREVDADFRWDGPASSATDYDRACDVVGDLQEIAIGKGRGVVLNSGDTPRCAIHRLSDRSAIIIEDLGGETDGLEKVLAEVGRDRFPSPEIFLDLKDGTLYLVDTTLEGKIFDDFEEHALPTKFAPGRYSLATTDIVCCRDGSYSLHWLQARATLVNDVPRRIALPAGLRLCKPWRMRRARYFVSR